MNEKKIESEKEKERIISDLLNEEETTRKRKRNKNTKTDI